MDTFKCALCGKTFKTNKLLVKHKSVHAKENRIFTCTKCQINFTDHCEYLLHEVTHLQLKLEHRCVECGVVKKKSGLAIHIMTHYEERKKACEFCNVVLPVEELKKHVRLHSFLNTTHKCNHCGKMIVACKYDDHIARHSVKEEYKCQYCDKVFNTKKNFNKHERQHTEDLKEVCKVCGLFFNSVKYLKYHEKKHLLSNKYECDYCQVTMINRMAFVNHIQRHMNGNRCTKKGCKFTAETKEEIAEHRRQTHFHCKHCRVGYTSGQTYKRHKLSIMHKMAADVDSDDD